VDATAKARAANGAAVAVIEMTRISNCEWYLKEEVKEKKEML
jgi:hypothetical protein